MRAVSAVPILLVSLRRGAGLPSATPRSRGALDKALEREHGIGLSEFEVLERLATTEDTDGRRMQDLADAVCLSQSALSRLIGRLETAGLVSRHVRGRPPRHLRAHHR